MNTNELVQYQQQVDKYIQDHKMTDVFEHLTRLLVLNRPDDPISFLIDALENRRVQRLILVSGVIVPNRQEIVQSISNLFNYKIIATEDLFKGDIGWINDEKVNSAVLKAYQSVERHYRGVILSGYPNNLQQAYFLQQRGIIPERFIYLESDLDFSRQYYETVQSKEETQKALTRDRLNRQDLNYIYGEFMDVFNTSRRTKDDIFEDIKQTLRPRDRKYPPLRFPRVCIVRPPSLRERAQNLCQLFSRKYGLKTIITFELIEQSIHNKGDLGPLIQNALLSEKPLPNDIVNSLVYTQFLSTEARNKGWILEGFPKNEAQLKFLKSHHVNLFIVLTEDEDILVNKSRALKIDPLTKTKYEKVPLNNKPLLDRLANIQVDDEGKLKERMQNYLAFVEKIKEKYGDRVQIFKLEKDTTENIQKMTEVFLNNPQIYN